MSEPYTRDYFKPTHEPIGKPSVQRPSRRQACSESRDAAHSCGLAPPRGRRGSCVQSGAELIRCEIAVFAPSAKPERLPPYLSQPTAMARPCSGAGIIKAEGKQEGGADLLLKHVHRDRSDEAAQACNRNRREVIEVDCGRRSQSTLGADHHLRWNASNRSSQTRWYFWYGSPNVMAPKPSARVPTLYAVHKPDAKRTNSTIVPGVPRGSISLG
jgi:hypothetical protein